MAEFTKRMVIQEILPALDNLERAMKHTPKDLKDQFRLHQRRVVGKIRNSLSKAFPAWGQTHQDRW